MAGIYRQHHPERTVLYRVLFHYFEEFVSEYENRFEREYGYFRPVIQEVVDTGREPTPGIIAVIQSFGSRINLHPHLHFLITEGGVSKQGRFQTVRARWKSSLLSLIILWWIESSATSNFPSKPNALPHLKLPSSSSWWQPKRGENISEGPWKQGFMNESLMQSILSTTHSPLWCTSSPSPPCWIHHFPYDMFIPACQKVKITENREGFVESTKRKFL